METTFTKKVKGGIIETIFDNSTEDFSIRFFNCLESVENWDENKTYKYKIIIRHSENTDARKLLSEEIKRLSK